MIEKNLDTNSSASWEILLGFLLWDEVSGEQNKSGISEDFWMWEMGTESSLLTLSFSFQISALSNRRNLGTEYLCKLCWYWAFWWIIQMWGFLWPWLLSPSPVLQVSPLCSGGRTPMAAGAQPVGQSSPMLAPWGVMLHSHGQGMRHQGAEGASCQCCCQGTGLIVVWLHRSADQSIWQQVCFCQPSMLV